MKKNRQTIIYIGIKEKKFKTYDSHCAKGGAQIVGIIKSETSIELYCT